MYFLLCILSNLGRKEKPRKKAAFKYAYCNDIDTVNEDTIITVSVMKGATLSTPPSTGLSGLRFSNTPNYIRRPRKTRNYR